MNHAVSRGELETVFGPGHVVTVPAERLNPLVTHEDTRRFLAESGLPDVPRFLYETHGEPSSGLSTVGDVEAEFGDFEELPDTARHWVVLGYCYGDTTILDGRTGEIWSLPQGALYAERVNSRIDLFVRFLVAFFRDAAGFGDRTDLATRRAAAERLTAELRAVDPAAFAEPEGFWYRLLEQLTLNYGQ